MLRRFPEVVEFQGEATQERGMQELVLRLEANVPGEEQQALGQRILTEMHTSLHLRPKLEFVSSGTLPRAEMKSRRFRSAPPS